MIALVYASVLTLLVAGGAGTASAACISKTCSDAAVVQAARDVLQDGCGCTLAEQSRSEYGKCVKRALKDARLPGLALSKGCRNVVMRCERSSICGDPDAVVCCNAKPNGNVVASIKGS